MKRSLRLAIIATSVSCALLTAAPSQACGGCFHQAATTTPSTVTGHRMAFAVSPERTVLWDSFEFTGAPDDFSWVLPVLPGAVLEESTDAWFETLEAATQTSVTSPTLTCASASGGGVGCGSSADASFAYGNVSDGPNDGNGVQVLHEGTVGPYETVTLRSTDANALTNWLTMHGYAIPPDIQPTIDAYTAEGDDFIAVRLQPGLSTKMMTPVRVVTPSGDYLLPLRMVAAGVAEHVNIVLYVIGEQRFAMPDLHEVSIDPQQLTWTFANNSSNYTELRKQALAKNLGFSYLPTFAQRGAFSKELVGPSGQPTPARITTDTDISFFSTLGDLYFGQANGNDNHRLDSCPSKVSKLNATALVTTDGAGSSIAKADFDCGKYTDLSAAMLGMHPYKVWITRLELDLPKEALTTDCTVVPAESQKEISNQLTAAHATDRPAYCQEPIFASRLARSSPGQSSFVVAVVLGGLLWLRRRGAAC